MATKSLKEKLDTIDSAITKRLKSLDGLIDKMEFREIGEFILTESIDKKSFNSVGTMGVYFFELKTSEQTRKDYSWTSWTEEFITKWDAPKHSVDKKYKSPLIYKGRIKAHSQLKEWVPLYVGISKDMTLRPSSDDQKSKGRMDQHFNHSADEPTYSLKLCARENLRGETIRLSVIEFDVNSYNEIAPNIEAKKRTQLNPIIGKQ